MTAERRDGDDDSVHRAVDQPVVGYFVPAAAVPAEELFTLSTVMRRIWRGRIMVGAATLAMAIAFVVWAGFVTRVYRVEVTVNVVKPDGASDALGGLGGLGQLSRLASIAGVSLGAGGSNARDELVAQLGSRGLQARFIERYKLVPVLFRDEWDAEQKVWRTKTGRAPSVDLAVEKLRRDVLKISQDKLSGLAVVAVEWRDPVLAARWANDYVALANEEARRRALHESTRSISYLNRELAATESVALQNAIYGLMQSQLRARMLANVRPEYAYRIIDPAAAPDVDRFARPRRLVYAVAGAFLGFLLGALVAIRRHRGVV